jgi:hypothetical protein
MLKNFQQNMMPIKIPWYLKIPLHN